MKASIAVVAVLALAACSDSTPGIVRRTGLPLAYSDDTDAGVRCYMWAALSGDSISCVRIGGPP